MKLTLQIILQNIMLVSVILFILVATVGAFKRSIPKVVIMYILSAIAGVLLFAIMINGFLFD